MKRGIRTEQILKAYSEGKSPSVIAKELPCAYQYVWRVLKTKVNYTGIRGQKNKLTTELINELREFKKTNTWQATCDKFKVSITTARRYCGMI